MADIPEKRLPSGFSMPVLGLGTWGMGGWVEKDARHDESAVAAIRRALDAGVTHIDTAERYAEGHAEELVGEAIRGRDRSRLFIVSKADPGHLAPDDLLRAAEGSLRRIGTPYLDLYLLHDPNPAIPIAETMRAMDRLLDDGRIRHIGLSNFSIREMEEAMRAARHPIMANQLQLNLSARKREQEGLLAHAQRHHWMFIAFRPIRDVLLLKEEPTILRDICVSYGKTPAQVAINWLTSQQNVVTMTKCGSPAHLEEALGAVGWSLTPEDVELLRRDFPQPAVLPRPVPPPP